LFMSVVLASQIGSFAAAALIVAASAASAQSVDSAGTSAVGLGYSAADAPLGKGQVRARCDMARPVGEMANLPIDRAGQTQTTFAVDCNTPFVLRVRSHSGGLENRVAPMGIEPLLPYEISVAVGTDQGRHDLGWCQASALTETPDRACVFAPGAPGGGWASGSAIAIDQPGALRMRWRRNESDRPLLGGYRDVIVIEVEARS
jgi:hypothetical protein